MILDRFHSHADGSFALERWQDVESIIERNRARQSMPQVAESFHHVAEIPSIFIEKWLMDEWKRGNRDMRLFSKEFDAMVLRKLRDPEWRWLKATDKKI